MRKAFMLIEMIVMLSLLLIALFMLTKPMKTVTADMPRMHRDFQTNISVLHMLKQLRTDVETSTGLLACAGDERIAPNLLLIDSCDAIISYQLDDGVVVRTIDSSDSSGAGHSSTNWLLPHAKIKWNLAKRGRQPYALEITTGIQRKVMGRWENKLQNSYVFFTGLMKKEAY